MTAFMRGSAVSGMVGPSSLLQPDARAVVAQTEPPGIFLVWLAVLEAQPDIAAAEDTIRRLAAFFRRLGSS